DEEGRLDGRQARTVRDGCIDGPGGASGMDAELAPSESRGDRRGSQGGRRAKLHPRDGSRSDRKSEPGRWAAAVRHRPDEGRPQRGSDHDDGTRGDRQATDGLTRGRVCEFERIGRFETAKTVGLDVPSTLLAHADRVYCGALGRDWGTKRTYRGVSLFVRFW